MTQKENFESAKRLYETANADQRYVLESLFPELKESEDERIRRNIIAALKGVGYYDCDLTNECIAWVEKQGKRDARYKSLEELLEADAIYQMAMNDAMVEEAKTKAIEAISDMPIFELLGLRKQSVQKPFDYENANIQQTDFAPKVESKFHKGDWIATSYGKVNQVITVDKDGDGYTLDDGVYFTGSWCDMYHLWDITKDAKDGDVLASDNSIFIFREEYIAEKPIAYCGLMNGLFIEGENACWTNENCTPATKEQRDTLMKAMADAGWEFDFDKKELKKIEQKPQRIISAEAKEAMYDKPWSEEDENMLNLTLGLLSYHRQCRNWLKSLKDRVQPKSQWKPSDEQMKVLLSEVTAWSKGCHKQIVLESLYQDLKKLREE